MAADKHKARFEPPPWEQEAFERFQKDREESKSREDLNAALRAVRAGSSPAEDSPAPQSVPPVEASTDPPASALGARQERPPAAGQIPEARIDSMLIQLRGEEPPAHVTNKSLVNGVTGFLVVAGTFIIIQSALLFGDVGAAGAANTMLAGTLSFMVFMTGLAFLGGAFLLFRKYHQ